MTSNLEQKHQPEEDLLSYVKSLNTEFVSDIQKASKLKSRQLNFATAEDP